LSGAQPDIELEPWKEAFVDMFLQTGASIGQGFGMKPETIAAMRLQISQMMSSVPVEDARQMLQLSIMQAHKVLNLMPPPEEYDEPSVDAIKNSNVPNLVNELETEQKELKLQD